MIAIAAVLLSLRFGGRALGELMLIVERRKRGLFYALFFFLSYEIGLVFENTRRLASGIAKALARENSFVEIALIAVLIVGIGAAAGRILGMIWRAWSQERAESRDVL
jgi:hypothetical protein